MECNKLVRAKVRAEQPEKIKAQKKKSYEQTKERHLTQKREYRQANKGKIAALNAARKAYIKQRTPKWLTVIDKERIQNEYKLAALQSKITGEPWHVDHVIPLQGKYVSGLHVPSNLKAIRGVENISKKNRFEVNYAK
jgi:5-methylcytosine-specific restriction endonuclease McrA